MMERFFDELRHSLPAADRGKDPPDGSEKLNTEFERDESFLAPLPTIRQIVWRKLFSAKSADAPDLVQKVVLQLLTWRKNNPNKIEEMTPEEWQSFASKAAHHAVNRNLKSSKNLNVPLDEADEVPSIDLMVGNTQAELASLVSKFWQGICELSLRQRRALLLGSESLLVILRLNGISDRELGEILELSENELAEVISRLPLKDAQIANLIAACSSEKNQNINSLIKSIKKARHEARARLKKLISE